jgi:hypothetical protein
LIQAAVSDLALDPSTGDLLVSGGDLVIVSGATAIAQDWQRRMGLFKGEWKLDRRVGIDYRNVILGDGRPRTALLRNIFETVTRETAGIKSVDRLEFTFDRHTRELTVDAEVTAVTGESIALVYKDVLFDDEVAA